MEFMDNHFYLLILIMIVSGVLGGLVNYWHDTIEDTDRHPIIKRISLGLAASFVVPLFLNTISSSLLAESKTDPLKLFVFAGFCIIAAISSKAFIKSLTKRILEKVEQVDKKQAEMEVTVEPIIAKETEPEIIENDKGIVAEGYGLVGEAKGIVLALKNPKYTWRYIGGISKESGASTDKVLETLEWLVINELARESKGKKGRIWALTSKGREVFVNLK
jgi:hypothetical protein